MAGIGKSVGMKIHFPHRAAGIGCSAHYGLGGGGQGWRRRA